MGTRVWIRRAYDDPSPNDGTRVLVDRLWPRGLSKEKAQVDEWLPDVAPSDELRRWFGHDPARFEEFRRRYRDELATKTDLVDELAQRAAKRRLTLVYGARDAEHNNAVVLREVLEERLAERAG
ncbi:MAG TPA: DUF488 family protein [Acidimicrobiales bacterium]